MLEITEALGRRKFHLVYSLISILCSDLPCWGIPDYLQEVADAHAKTRMLDRDLTIVVIILSQDVGSILGSTGATMCIINGKVFIIRHPIKGLSFRKTDDVAAKLELW